MTFLGLYLLFCVILIGVRPHLKRISIDLRRLADSHGRPMTVSEEKEYKDE